jgi:hypothetical protein
MKLTICIVALLATVFAVLVAAMAVDWNSYKIDISYTRVAAAELLKATVMQRVLPTH